MDKNNDFDGSKYCAYTVIRCRHYRSKILVLEINLPKLTFYSLTNQKVMCYALPSKKLCCIPKVRLFSFN